MDDESLNDTKQADDWRLGVPLVERRDWTRRRQRRRKGLDCSGEVFVEVTIAKQARWTTTLDENDGCSRRDLQRAEMTDSFWDACDRSHNNGISTDDDESRMSDTHEDSGAERRRQRDSTAASQKHRLYHETQRKQLSSTSPSNKASNSSKKKSGSSWHTTNSWDRTTVLQVAVSRHTISLWNRTTAQKSLQLNSRSAQTIINKIKE